MVNWALTVAKEHQLNAAPPTWEHQLNITLN